MRKGTSQSAPFRLAGLRGGIKVETVGGLRSSSQFHIQVLSGHKDLTGLGGGLASHFIREPHFVKQNKVFPSAPKRSKLQFGFKRPLLSYRAELWLHYRLRNINNTRNSSLGGGLTFDYQATRNIIVQLCTLSTELVESHTLEIKSWCKDEKELALKIAESRCMSGQRVRWECFDWSFGCVRFS